MSVNVLNLAQGPGALYIGDFGATEPADAAINSAPAASAWDDAGGTLGGTTVTINQEFSELMVDQIVDVVGRRLTKRDTQIQTQMAEVTLENLQRAANDGAIATGGNWAKFAPSNVSAATQPTYRALLFDAYAPGSNGPTILRRRIIARKVLAIANIGAPHAKDAQTVFPVTWGTHYVSDVIEPYVVVDQTA